MLINSQKLTRQAGAGKHPTNVAGLSLKVSPKGKGRWVLRWFPEPQVAKEVTLGALDKMDYSAAVAAATAIREGKAEAKPAMLKKRAAPPPAPVDVAPGERTFRIAAAEYITSATPRWRDQGKSAAQWRKSLETHAYPHIGDMNVRDIDVSAVLSVLRPIWATKAETANRVRSRIESILLAEAGLGNRPLDKNPAAKKLIEAVTGIKHVKGDREELSDQALAQGRIGSRAAMPLDDLFDFVAHLWDKTGMSHRALLFLIHTCAREGMVCLAEWSEIDWQENVWRIPQRHMKSGKSFTIPLTPQAIQVLQSLGPNRTGFIFRTPRKTAPRRKGADIALPPKSRGLSNAAMDEVVKRWVKNNPGKLHATVHGMRTTCHTALENSGKFDLAICQRVLSHATGSRVRRAYVAAENVELRRPLMEYWSDMLQAGYEKAVLG